PRPALVVLLPVGHPRMRVGRNEDAGLGAVDAALPGAFRRGHLPVLLLLRVLAHVPDVSLVVLGVPVVGVLLDLAATGGDVVHDPGVDPEDLLGCPGHGDLDALLVALGVGLAVDPPAARRHRPVGVVDLGGEAGRVEAHGLTATGE